MSNNTAESILPQIATSGNHVYVTWQDATPGSFDIFLAVSNNNGTSFGSPINISNNGVMSLNPQIAAIGSNVYVTWEDRTPGSFDIFFAVSNNNGTSFGSPINLSNNAGFSERPQIAISGNNVYVTWADHTPGDADIFFAVSNNNGTSFGSPINISNNAGGSVVPQIATIGNNVYVTWYNEISGNLDTFFAASNNNGTSFGTPINLSNNAGSSLNPQIAASGNDVYVVWQDDTLGNAEVFFRASSNGGNTFNTTINLSNNAGSSLRPQIAASGNNVFVTWQDSTPGNNDILFAVSINNGTSFVGIPINISNNAGSSLDPQIAASGNNVFVTWQDTTPDHQF